MHSDFYQEEELKGSLSNFEQSLKYDKVKYFEVFEFEFIIDHYIVLGEHDNSKKAIQRALIIHPKSHEIQKRLAQVKNIEGLFEEAVRILDESFLSFGIEKDIDYYLIIGESFLGMQKTKKAKKAFDKAIDISGEEYFDIVTTVASLYQQEGFFEELIVYLKLVENEDSSLLFDIGVAYYNAFDFENAIVYLKRFIPSAPFSIDAWLHLSKSYQAIGDFDAAEDALQNVIAIEPKEIIYLYDLAKIYVEQSKYIDALNLYKEILSQDKEVNYSIFLSIGDISYNLGQYENSKKNYEIALRLNPESDDAHHSLGQVEIDFDNYESAKKHIQKAIAINSEKAEYFISLGAVNQLIGDVIRAELAFVEATKINSGLEMAWNLLIDFYFFSEKPDTCLKTAFKALESIKKSSSILCKISAAYFDLKEFDLGLKYLGEAIDEEPESIKFFLEYYPEAIERSGIMHFIKKYK